MIFDVVGYREWARLAFAASSGGRGHLHFHDSIEGSCPDARAVFLVGWSEILKREALGGRLFLVVHPSDLPAYRGGSPLQHQIIDGLLDTQVTLFQLDPDGPVDSGPVFGKLPLSLRGDLAAILRELALASAILISRAILAIRENEFTTQPQAQLPAARKRRHPEESELLWTELTECSAERLYNKIRALQDPYPNAFIRTADGRKLYITGAHVGD